VLDEPYWTARLCNPKWSNDVKRDLNVAVTRAKNKFVFIGSSEWLNRHAKLTSGLGQMWDFLKDRADLIPVVGLVGLGSLWRGFDHSIDASGWRDRGGEKNYTFELLDELSFFDRFADDLNAASSSIFGLAPYFGEYRWPRVEPFFRAALARGVEVTLVTPPTSREDHQKPACSWNCCGGS
jgi:hypothetical protein